MEFALPSLPKSLAPRKAVEQYLLSRLDQIDEREISNPKLAQTVFLLKHRDELSKKAEKKLIPKVLEDICFVLENKWAKEISGRDFFHGHICVVSQLPMFDLDDLLSEVNVRLLYHTCEEWHEMPYFAHRNIKSSLVSKPKVIPIEYEEFVDKHGYRTYRFSKIAVGSSDLGWSEYGKIEFEKTPEGPYRLKNGTRLKMRGVLSPNLIYYTKIRNGVIEFDGKAIGRTEPFETWHLNTSRS